VSAELVTHAPSGAPEQLICCVVAPRLRLATTSARWSRVRRARACARRRRQWWRRWRRWQMAACTATC